MKLSPLSLIPLVTAVAGPILLAAVPVFAATPTAILSLTPASASLSYGSPLGVDVILNTGGQGAAGVDVHITLPAGLTYTSSDASASVFTNEVTPPTVSGTDLHFARLLTTANGYTGASGEVIHLVFTAAGTSSVSQLAFNQANSSVGAYSDSSNILSSVNNGTYTVGPAAGTAPSSSATPVPAVTSPAPTVKAPALPVTGAPTATVTLAALLSFTMGTVALFAIRKEFTKR